MSSRILVLSILTVLFQGLAWGGGHSIPENWQVELKLEPINDDAVTDVINLVPKQSVMMKFYVWFPTSSIWIPRYPDWDMPGTNIEKFNTSTPGVERKENGLHQYGQVQNYILTPVDIGTLQLKQEYLDVSPKQDESERVPFSHTVRLNVALPDGFFSVDSFLPAYGVEVAQEFYLYTRDDEPQLLNTDEVDSLLLKKGAMLERRIRIEALGIKGSSIPRLVLKDKQTGVQRESAYEDTLGIFGFTGGSRTESFFYSPGEGGLIELEPFDIEWWHLKNKELKTIRLPGISFDSEKVVHYEKSIAPSFWEKVTGDALTWLLYALMALVGVYAFYRLVKQVAVRCYFVGKKTLGRFTGGELFLFMSLLTSLLFNEQKSRGLFFLWHRRQNIDSLHPDLEMYFLSSYQPGRKPDKPKLRRVVFLCIALHWRMHRNSRKEGRKYKHSLPT